MRKSQIVIMLCLLWTGSLLAQERPQPRDSTANAKAETRAEAKASRKTQRLELRAASEKYLVGQLGLGFGQTLDARMAENRYLTSGMVMTFGQSFRNPRRIIQYTVDTRALAMGQSHFENLGFNSFNQLTFQYLRPVHETAQGGRIYAGGELGLLGNVRLLPAIGNSSLNLDFVPSLSAVGRYEREASLPFMKRKVQLEASLRLPLANYVMRIPSYALSGLDGSSTSFAPIGDFTRVVTEIGISNAFGNNNPNRWALSYQWDFYAYRDIEVHPLRVANHAFIYSLYFRTN